TSGSMRESTDPALDTETVWLKAGNASTPRLSTHSPKNSHFPEAVGNPPAAKGVKRSGSPSFCQPAFLSAFHSMPRMASFEEASAVRQMSSSESRKHGSSKPMRAASRRNTSEFGSDSPIGEIAGLFVSA